MPKGYKHLTQEQKAQILESYARTKTTTATAKEVGVTWSQVTTYLKSQGVELTKAQERGKCWQNQDLLRKLAAEGASLSEMSRQIGANRRHIVAFLERHEIPYEKWDRSKPENNPFWRGGRIQDADGYVLLKTPDHPHKDRHGYVREHRLVMEEQLGRYLLPTEVVDHIDGDRANNDPSNLRVFASNREHLAETLKRRRPNWTPEGFAAMQANGYRLAERRRASSRSASEPDDDQSPQTSDQTAA